MNSPPSAHVGHFEEKHPYLLAQPNSFQMSEFEVISTTSPPIQRVMPDATNRNSNLDNVAPSNPLPISPGSQFNERKVPERTVERSSTSCIIRVAHGTALLVVFL